MVLSFILIQNRQSVTSAIPCEPYPGFSSSSISCPGSSVDQLTKKCSLQRQNPFSEMVFPVQRQPILPSDLLPLTLAHLGRREDKTKRRGMNIRAPFFLFLLIFTAPLSSNHCYRSTGSSHPGTKNTNPTSLSSGPSRLFTVVTPGSSSACASMPTIMSWPTWRQFTSL